MLPLASHGNLKMQSRDTNDWILLNILKDARYKDKTADELKMIRANMINSGTATKYDLSCVQYWIMEKEDRIPQWNS